jgi:hypothetical protein
LPKQVGRAPCKTGFRVSGAAKGIEENRLLADFEALFIFFSPKFPQERTLRLMRYEAGSIEKLAALFGLVYFIDKDSVSRLPRVCPLPHNIS